MLQPKLAVIDEELSLDPIVVFQLQRLEFDEATASAEVTKFLKSVAYVHAVVKTLPKVSGELLTVKIQAGPRQYVEPGELRPGPGVTPAQLEEVRSGFEMFFQGPNLLHVERWQTTTVNGWDCAVESHVLGDPPRVHVDVTVLRKAETPARPGQ